MTPAFGAAGGTCPEGYSSLTHSYTVLAAVCPEDSIDLGTVVLNCDDASAVCSPDVLCDGMKDIHAGDVVSVPLYSTKFTTPALNVAMGGTTCYANLIPGHANGAINIDNGTGVYHTTNALHRCLKLSVANTPVMSVSANNSVVWRGTSGESKIIGTSICSSTSGSVGTMQTSVATATSNSDTSVNNKYCWCRMRRPVPSKWVFAQDMGAYGTCNTTCAATCANVFTNNQSFRSIIIGSGID